MSSSTGAASWQAPMTQPNYQPSPPATAASPANISDEEGVTVKPMRLKVLYTFDDQNKTNCLARWPHVLQIRTVAIDDTATIGVIELKTCIQAIVQCSPELVARLGHDYTVYAYDFSEYDQPLVGQGMLSWALAASSPTPDGPASESEKLVTGRVCKNIQGLFSNGVKETLEVKLRLVPVPTLLQSEYLDSMERYREVSRYMPAVVDQNEWQNLLQSNPHIGQIVNKISTYSGMTPGSSHEVVNQLLSPSLSQHNQDPFNNPAGNEGMPVDGRNTPRGSNSSGRTSRPASRVSVKRSRKPLAPANTAGDTSGYEDGTDMDEGPPIKKRAKVVQADWGGKSTFGLGAESLRVAASTTNSIRAFRPIAVAPQHPIAGGHLQDVPRAATPVPNLPRQPMQRAGAASRRNSSLSQAPTMRYASPYQLPEATRLPQDTEIRLSIEAAMSSPEKEESAGETPLDIASSPPVLRDASTRHSTPHDAPSSPVLPQMPRTDSGFMSGGTNEMADLFGEDFDTTTQDRTAPEPVLKRKPREGRRGRNSKVEHHGFAIQEVTPGPPELLPTTVPTFDYEAQQVQYRRATKRAGSVMSDDSNNLAPPMSTIPQPSPLATMIENNIPAVLPTIAPAVFNTSESNFGFASVHVDTNQRRPSTANSQPPLKAAPSRPLSRTASMGSLTLPASLVPASDPILAPTSLSRSQTWSEVPNMGSDGPQSEASRSKSAIAKKTLIRKRLEAAVAEGAMPPFCHNCGAIDTPTWRKCFAQDVQGAPEYHEYSDAPGKIIAINVLTKDDQGRPTSYKLYKKTLGPNEKKADFEDILLCNPCGIWLTKFKSHRPEKNWFKESKPRRKNGSRAPPRPKRSNTDSQPVATSDAWFQSDAPAAYEPFQGYMMEQTVGPNQTQEAPQPTYCPALPNNSNYVPIARQRASSVRPAQKPQMTTDVATSALRRAIQSSPAGRMGTHHSPIEIQDEELGSTKRLLFPSPRKEGIPKVLGEVAMNVAQPTAHISPTRAKAAVALADKENFHPLHDEDDDPITKMIEEELSRERGRASTPPPKAAQLNVFKTPTRPAPHRPVTRSVSRSARSARSERLDALPQRTPSKTPTSTGVRRSPRHANPPESPFTASLNKLMSEANNDHMSHSPSRHLDLGLDFSLPDLGHSTIHHSDGNFLNMAGFDNQDFFSTDVPMPSSPPRMFGVYEDSMSMAGMGMDHMDSDIWNDFQLDVGAGNGSELGGLLIDENGRASFGVVEVQTLKIKEEPMEDTAKETQL